MVFYRIFLKIDYILGCRVSFNKYRGIEIIYFILVDYNRIKLDIMNKRNYKRYTNLWSLNSIRVNDECVIEEIKNKFEIFLELS